MFDRVLNTHLSIGFAIISSFILVNPIVANALFHYPLTVFRYFQGVEKGALATNWLRVTRPDHE